MPANNLGEALAQLGQQVKLLADAQREMRVQLQRDLERWRGVKIVRFPLIEVAAANPLVIQADQFGVAPEQGYVWSLRLVVIEGLTAGAVPDVVNMLRSQQRIIWQFNGNNFGQTWGKGEEILFPGETLGFASVGNFASTSRIIIHGHAWEVPAEKIGELLG